MSSNEIGGIIPREDSPQYISLMRNAKVWLKYSQKAQILRHQTNHFLINEIK